MSDKNKKLTVVVLLILSSVASGWLLFSHNPSGNKTLRSISEVDSLLQEHFNRFNINSREITQVHHTVDSGFTRKEYYLKVPPSFSQTQFHANLHRNLHTYDIRTPASVDMENQNMTIHLYYGEAVIRSLHLRMEPSLKQDKNPASILVVFNEAPSPAALQQLISFGEPIPLVFRVETALEAKQLKNTYSDRYAPLAFWFIDGSESGLPGEQTRPSDLQPLKRFGKLSPQSHVISFLPDSLATPELRAELNDIPLQYIQARHAIRVNFNKEQASLNRILQRFETEARNRRHPLLLLRNSGDLLKKTHEAILQFKKRGLTILKPPSHSY